jgi:hypothetical protein
LCSFVSGLWPGCPGVIPYPEPYVIGIGTVTDPSANSG